MKKIITLIIFIISVNAFSQNWEWVKLIQPFDNLTGMGIMVSPHDGHVYSSGGFNQSIDFGNSHTLSGNHDGYLAQFDTAGLCQWANRIYVTTQGCGCTMQGNTSGSGINAFDSGGNLIVAGTFCGCGATFGSGITSSSSGYNIFIAKYSPAGVCLWVQTKPGSFNSSTGQTFDAIQALTIDASDNIYVSIYNYAAGTTFCGLSFANQGIILAKINSSGNGLWYKYTGLFSSSNNLVNIFNLQASKNRIYAGGIFFNTSAIGTNTFTASGYNDAFISMMDTSGNVLRSSQISGSGSETVTSLAVSGNRAIILANTDNNAVTIGTHTLNTNGSKDKTFLVAYDTTSLTVQNYTNTAHDSLGSGTGLYADLKGNMYLLANNSAATGFGNIGSIAAGRHVIRMDNTLTNHWYTQSVGTWVAPDTLGNIYILDGFTSSASYGSSLSETSSGYGITLGKIHNAISLGSGGFRMAQTNTMQVYPNPSGGLFNLQLGTNVKHNNAKITLYDLNGRVIADNIPFTKQDENTLQIDLTKYVEGSYIIKAEVDNVLYSAKLER